MKKIVLSALALASAAGMAQAQSALNFRIVAVNSTVAANSQAEGSKDPALSPVGTPVNSFNAPGPWLNTRNLTQSVPTPQGTNAAGLVTQINAQNTANPSGSITLTAVGQRVVFVLQAQWVNIPGALGLASAGGRVATNEVALGSNMDRYIENAANQSNIDNNDPATRLVFGTFAPYDKLASLGSYTDPAANGNPNTTGNLDNSVPHPGVWGVDDIRGLQTGGTPTALATGIWANIYAWSYVLAGGGAGSRDVTFTFSDAARYSAPYDGISGGQPHPIDSTAFTTSGATYTIHVNIPAPASAALLGLGGLVAARRRRTA